MVSLSKLLTYCILNKGPKVYKFVKIHVNEAWEIVRIFCYVVTHFVVVFQYLVKTY